MTRFHEHAAALVAAIVIVVVTWVPVVTVPVDNTVVAAAPTLA